MALTSEQLADFRADIGDSAGAFSDGELQRLYERSSGSYAGAVVLAYQQLLINAAKFNDYVAGQTQEKRSQIFNHLKDMLAYWKSEAEAGNEFHIVGLKSVPRIHKELPANYRMPKFPGASKRGWRKS